MSLFTWLAGKRGGGARASLLLAGNRVSGRPLNICPCVFFIALISRFLLNMFPRVFFIALISRFLLNIFPLVFFISLVDIIILFVCIGLISICLCTFWMFDQLKGLLSSTIFLPDIKIFCK